MGSSKPPAKLAKECEKRAQEVASEGDREQLLAISRRLREAMAERAPSTSGAK